MASINIRPGARTWVYHPTTVALPVTPEISVGGSAWQTMTPTTSPVGYRTLVAGPGATDSPGGTIVVTAGASKVLYRNENTPQVAVNDGGWIFLLAAGVAGVPDTTGTGATDAQLIAWALAESYSVTDLSRDSNGAAVTGNIVWPDGTVGVFLTLTASTAFPGSVDSYQVTYSTRVITQPLVTRDEDGAVIAQPSLVIT